MPKSVKVKTPQPTPAVLSTAELLKQAQAQFAIPVPEPAYIYQKGQSVQIGHVLDLRVEEVLDGGKFLALSYHDRGERQGRKYDNGRQPYGLRVWYHLAPAGEKAPVFMKPRKQVSYVSCAIHDLLGTLEHSGVQDSPEYQRDYVWSMGDKIQLIESLMNRSDIGKFILIEGGRVRDYHFEILDGKQRINALQEFRLGSFKYKGCFYWDLEYSDRSEIDRTIVPVAYISQNDLTRVEKLELFLNVNVAGVPQTFAHLAKVEQLLEEARALEAI